MRILTSGESHGDSLYAIIDGFPSGFKIDKNKINKDLFRRLDSIGRGPRSKKENDEIMILTGVTGDFITTGAPITLQIKNDLKDLHSEENVPRPGHADLAGAIKYNHKNVRNVLERASARKTAMDVAIGSLCSQVLDLISVRTCSTVNSVFGKEYCEDTVTTLLKDSPKETYGGSVTIGVVGLPMGIGSYVNDFDKIDGILAKTVLSVNSVKAIAFGKGIEAENLTGYEYVDRIYYNDAGISLKSNNSGGIDGGMTNGNKIIIKAFIKPIPTQFKDVESINLKTLKQESTFKERGDNFVLEPISLVIEMTVATKILDILLDKFDSDNILLFKRSYDNYIKYIKEFFDETSK